MSQRTKLGLALGNREGQVWGGKKIVIPKDESGRRRVHRKGGVLYHLIDIGDDPTGLVGTRSNVEDEQPTPSPSMNGRLLQTGEWFHTTLDRRVNQGAIGVVTPVCPTTATWGAKVLTLVLTLGQGSAKGQHNGQHI